MRAEKPMIIYGQGEEWYIDKEGRRTGDILRAGKISYAEIQELVDYWCQDSRYAYQKELKNGYLTMKGGHRIGICGEAVISREEKIQTIKHISSLNIRIAHQCKMAGAQVLAHLYNGDRLYNTLIISPPGAGKTTMLRDLVRRISDGSRNALGKTVGLVDEHIFERIVLLERKEGRFLVCLYKRGEEIPCWTC